MKSEKELYRVRGMCTLIRMEYLVANALVELYESKNITRISLDDIRRYGYKVEEKLEYNNIRAILLYSNNYTKEFLDDYSEWFEKVGDYIQIRKSKSIEDIRKEILSHVPVDVLLALLNEDSLQILHNL